MLAASCDERLRRRSLVISYGLIPPGVDYTRKILREFSAADAALLLLDASFLASQYVNDVELPYVLRRDSLFLVPVMIDHCDTKSARLEHLEILFKDQPLGRMRGRRAEAHMQIVRGLGDYFATPPVPPHGPRRLARIIPNELEAPVPFPSPSEKSATPLVHDVRFFCRPEHHDYAAILAHALRAAGRSVDIEYERASLVRPTTEARQTVFLKERGQKTQLSPVPEIEWEVDDLWTRICFFCPQELHSFDQLSMPFRSLGESIVEEELK